MLGINRRCFKRFKYMTFSGKSHSKNFQKIFISVTFSLPNGTEKSPGTPFLVFAAQKKLQARLFISALHPGKFPLQNSGDDKYPPWLDSSDKPLALAEQKVREKIGANHGVLLCKASRKPVDVQLNEMNASIDSVFSGIRPGNSDCVGIEIQRLDWSITQFCGSNCQNARASACVQKRLFGFRIAPGYQFAQTKFCRRMLSGAETQPWINMHNGLAFASPSSAPTRKNKQG